MNIFPVLIIGGGPAGMSALYGLKRFGIQAVLLEKEFQTGGLQRLSPNLNNWLPGWSDPTCEHVAERIEADCLEIGCQIMPSAEIERIEPCSETSGYRLFGTFGEMRSRRIVIATGVSFVRDCGIFLPPDENILRDHRQSLQRLSPPISEDRRDALVVGAGDNGYLAAAHAASRGMNVTILRRGEVRANKSNQLNLRSHPNVREITGRMIACQKQPDGRLSVDVSDGYRFTVDEIHLNLGYKRNTEFLAKCLPDILDSEGYVKRDPWSLETSVSGMYAIGECARMRNPCTAACMGEAMTVSRVIDEATGAS